MNIRPWLGVAPLALAIALGAHLVRYGNEHAFGGRYADGLVALLVAGILGGLTLAFWALIAAAGRPGAALGWSPLGLTLRLAGLASLIFVGGELLEGPGLHDAALPLAIVAMASLAAAAVAHRLAEWLRVIAGALLSIVERVAQPRVMTLVPTPHFCNASVRLAYSRFSRPPPRA